MASETHDPSTLKRRLYEEISKERTGMLGLSGDPPRHLQPMTAFCEKDGGPIWFYARKDNDLIEQAGPGHSAMFCFLTKNHDFIACLGGELREDHDAGKIEEFWNPVAGAWFPEGKSDPMLTLIRFDPADAQIWVSHGNPVKFGWEIAKANLTHTLPEVGEKQHLDL